MDVDKIHPFSSTLGCFNRGGATMTNLDSAGVPSPSRLEGKYKAMVVCWFLGLGSLVSWNTMLTIGDYYYNLFPPIIVINVKLPIVKYYCIKAASKGSKTVSADLAAAGIYTEETANLPIVKYYCIKAASKGSKTVSADLAAAGIHTEETTNVSSCPDSDVQRVGSYRTIYSPYKEYQVRITKWHVDSIIIAFPAHSRVPLHRKVSSCPDSDVQRVGSYRTIYSPYKEYQVRITKWHVDSIIIAFPAHSRVPLHRKVSSCPDSDVQRVGSYRTIYSPYKEYQVRITKWHVDSIIIAFPAHSRVPLHRKSIKLESQKGMLIASLSRFLLILTFYFTAKYGDQGWMILLVSFLGLTNGSFTVCVLTAAPKGYKCKKHPADLSSGIGVCASCLRESLFALIAAQARKTGRSPRRSPGIRYPTVFSCYSQQSQVASASLVTVEVKKKSSGGKFSSLFLGLFRSKSEKLDSNSGPFLDPGVVGTARELNPQDSCTSSPSWFPTILPARWRKQISTLSLDKNLIGDHMTIF
ncbi:Uncharacterized protein Fot_38889 [Forsythia ovata]|uniref:Uncharacterized protein n=1 Tax=Forsythia ovata TaxID=205694 RepID=A0ABD1S339_9LAMI